MATTISLEAFRAALGLCADYILAKDWSNANLYYAQAEAINAGLEVQVGDAGQSLRRRESLDGLRTAIATAEAKTSAGDSTSRFIKTQTGFSG